MEKGVSKKYKITSSADMALKHYMGKVCRIIIDFGGQNFRQKVLFRSMWIFYKSKNIQDNITGV